MTEADLLTTARRSQAGPSHALDELLRRDPGLAGTFIEKAPIMVVVLDPEGRIVRFNRYLEEVLGYRLDEIQGREWFDVFDPEHERDYWRTVYLATVDNVQTRGASNPVLAKDGRVRHIAWFDRTLRDADGTTVGVLALGQDITARKEAEEALRASEAQSRAILAAIPDMVFRLRRDGTFVGFHAQSDEPLAAPRDAIIGRTMEQVGLPPALVEKAHRAIADALDRGTIQTFEYELDVRGTLRHYEARLVPHGPDEVLSIVRDITERKRLEDELARARNLESLGMLAGGIAHDFNNLLSVILGNVSLAREQVDDASPAGDSLGDAEHACRKAERLTTQLLTFASGGAPVRRPLQIAGRIRESAMLALLGSSVECEFDIQEDLCLVDADEIQIHQVISNLVMNAAQAMPDGGTVTVHARNVVERPDGDAGGESRRCVRITIEDRGVGIDEADLRRVFDPFFTTKPQSTGLGLSIVHSVVQQHSGHVRVTSQRGVGTTVSVYLPACGERQEVAAASSETPTRGPGRILLTDDDEFIRRTGGAMLRYLGYEPTLAADGAQAVDLYRKALDAGTPFDAVLLDLTVPGGMGGKEVLKKLRRIDPAVRAIVSSGYSNDPLVAEHAKHGFAGVVAKPYNISQLREVLAAVAGPPGARETTGRPPSGT